MSGTAMKATNRAKTTATATMRHGGSSRAPGNKAIILKVDLADNISPVKLTKRGAGALTIAADELPADAVVSVEQGSLAGAGVTFAEFSVDVAKAAEDHGTIPSWPAGAKLNITGLDALSALSKVTLLEFATPPVAVPELADGIELPELWRLAIRGNSLVLCREKGLQLILR